MNNIKINILYDFHKGPWGGGNQFLKALKKELLKKGIYENNPKNAHCILYNSHHNFENVIKFKLKNQSKIFIHRIDGPISNYRINAFDIEKRIYNVNNLLADGTIFQSNWSKEQNYKFGIKKNRYETIIANAPAPFIFNNKNKSKFDQSRKIKLIANSWEPNWNKGFKIYQYLDNNLNFSKYKMTFIGRSPIRFKNIKWIKPLKSEDLAKQLKLHDIFISGSKEEACSNSLIEALHCGLPAVVPEGGSNSQILSNAGELFKSESDVIDKIKKVVKNYSFCQKNINLPMIDVIAEEYYNFCNKIFQDYKQNKYLPKRVNYLLLFKQKFFEFKNKLRKIGIFEYLLQIVLNNINKIIKFMRK